jgi:hypothetical protein
MKNSLLEDPAGSYYVLGRKQLQSRFLSAELVSAAHFLLTKHFTFNTLLSGNDETYSLENLLIKDNSTKLFARRLCARGTAEAMLDFTDRFHGALRYNHIYTQDGTNFSNMILAPVNHDTIYGNHYPNVNAEIVFVPASWLSINSDARYEYIPVSFTDRFGTGDRFIGNSNLLPERKSEWSIVGIKANILKPVMAAAGRHREPLTWTQDFIFYISRINDKIYHRAQSQQLFISENNGSVDVWGYELNSMLRLKGIRNRFFVTAQIDNSFSVNDSKVSSYIDPLSIGTTPPYEPKYHDNLRATLSLPYITIGHNASFGSSYYQGINNSGLKPGQRLLSAFISFCFSHASFTYRIENYLNEQDEFYYLTTEFPGRTHYFVGQFTF